MVRRVPRGRRCLRGDEGVECGDKGGEGEGEGVRKSLAEVVEKGEEKQASSSSVTWSSSSI